MSINLRLKKVLDLKMLKIKDFSETSGLTYRTAQNYLSGDRRPDAEGFFKINTHLGVDLNWLITGVGEPFIGGEDATAALPAAPALNPEETELLAMFRQLNPEARAAVFGMMQPLLPKKAASSASGEVA